MLYFRQKCTVFFSVVDAKSLYPDPDMGPVSAFQVNPDTAEKKLSYFDQKLQFAYLYCPVQVPLPVFCTQPFSFPVKRELSLRQTKKKCAVFSSVVDPDSLNPDSDTDPVPAFQVNPDTAEKNYLISIKNCNLLIFTVQFRYPYPHSAPNHSLSLSREQATYVILQTKV
jgi:hypothetical protein